jgi:hypothetical protein
MSAFISFFTGNRSNPSGCVSPATSREAHDPWAISYFLKYDIKLTGDESQRTRFESKRTGDESQRTRFESKRTGDESQRTRFESQPVSFEREKIGFIREKIILIS